MNDGITAAPTERALTNEENKKVTEAIFQFAKVVCAIAKQSLRPGFELEDLMQEGYLGLQDAVLTWRADGGASFATIANLRIRDRIRAAVSVKRDMHRISESFDADADEGLSLHDVVGEDPNQESDFEASEGVEIIRRAMNDIGDTDREVLNAFQEFSEGSNLKKKSKTGCAPKIAAKLGLPVSTTKDRLDKAKRNLREAFEQTPPAILRQVA